MTFYFKPPRGRIEIDKMIDCLQQRLLFISSVFEQNKILTLPNNLTYFVEGTAIDRTSHYLLRLISLQPESFQRHVINAETALFQKRLEFLHPKDFPTILKTCKNHSEELISTRHEFLRPQYIVFLQSVGNLCSDILRKPGGIDHAFHHAHHESCTAMFIRVPFRTCLELVASRKARLRKGEAIVPCGAWRLLLVAVFRMHLHLGYEDMELSGCCHEALTDTRVLQITKLMQSMFKNQENEAGNRHSRLSCSKLADAESHQLLPPCVLNMLTTLRTQHRIGHHARVALTLILKEAGMPLNEALAFWRKELSMPACHKHGTKHAGCTHSWQTDERKFTYSVRHLYGLEGARKNYAAPSCATIQGQILAPGAVGGCPFIRLPEGALLPLLQGVSEEVVVEVTKLASEGKPLHACRHLLLGRLIALLNGKDKLDNQRSLSTASVFSKPSQFYALCRDWSEEF